MPKYQRHQAFITELFKPAQPSKLNQIQLAVKLCNRCCQAPITWGDDLL